MPAKLPAPLIPDYTERLEGVSQQIDRCLEREALLEQHLQAYFDPYAYEQAEPWHLADPLAQQLLNLQIRLDNFAIKMETAIANIRHVT